jgi:hypothetical protein
MKYPAIVVIAFNRVEPLKRLLRSISNADYPEGEITLHISIDASDVPGVLAVAEEFYWKFGPKNVDLKPENRGLKKHVLECGQLVDVYESIIVLEDDLLVSPSFYRFATMANSAYLNDTKIAGVSLYSYAREENNFYPFVPYKDGSSVHFIQIASSWGQCWTKEQWWKFKEWLIQHPQGKLEQLPEYVIKWGSKSWKLLFVNYLLDTDRYFVFPNVSYTTNFEEDGTNVSTKGLFQVELAQHIQNPLFSVLAESNSVYDVYFELTQKCIKAIQPELAPFDFDVDLYGEKPLNFSSFETVLTLRPGSNPLFSYGAAMQPLIQNVEYKNVGTEINLFRKSDLRVDLHQRFLHLTTEHERLKQYAVLHANLVQRTTLILPVNRQSIERLHTSLNGFEKNRTNQATVIIVYPHEIKSELDALLTDYTTDFLTLECDTNEINKLLRLGIESCRSEYIGWMQAGMTIKFEELEDIANLFRSIHQVHFICGINENVSEANYERTSTANYRWTPELGNCYQKEMANVTTELMFWRYSTFKEIHTDQWSKNAHLFIETIKRTPLYVCAKKFGNINGIKDSQILSVEEVKTLLSDKKFQARKGIKTVTRPVFRYFFNRNIPIFRLFYRETERLPMVIRYDFKHNNYYLDNY